jgi:hypothetical protein
MRSNKLLLLSPLAVLLPLIVIMTPVQIAHADTTGAYDAGGAQARADYFGGSTAGGQCPTSWPTDYCAVYKAGYGIECGARQRTMTNFALVIP